MKDDITERKPRNPAHFTVEGTTYVGPDSSNPGTLGVNAGRATKDVRMFSRTSLRPCKGVVENS